MTDFQTAKKQSESTNNDRLKKKQLGVKIHRSKEGLRMGDWGVALWGMICFSRSPRKLPKKNIPNHFEYHQTVKRKITSKIKGLSLLATYRTITLKSSETHPSRPIPTRLAWLPMSSVKCLALTPPNSGEAWHSNWLPKRPF